MIKKTFQTIFKTKTILIMSSILIVIYYLTEIILRQSLFSITDSLARAMFRYTILSYTKFIIISFFIMPPLIYLVHKTVSDTSTEKWYFNGITKTGFRYLIFASLILLISNTLLTTLSIAVTSALTNMILMAITSSIMYSVFPLLILWLQFFGGVPIVAEGSFFRGIKNAIVIGKKYLLHYIALYIVLSLIAVYISSLAISAHYWSKIIYYIALFVSSAIDAAIDIFLIVYVMHRYTSAKNEFNSEYENELT